MQDRRPASEGDLIEAPPLPADDILNDDGGDSDFDDNEEINATPSSSKIEHLVSLLRLIPATEKSLVFSQFTSFLDLIATQLEKEG